MKYETLVFDPLRDMTHQVMSFIPTLITALGILIIGWILARWIRVLFTHVLKSINFDKFSDSVGLSRILKVGGLKHKPSEVFSCIVYSVLMVMVFMMTVKTFGVTIVSESLDKVLLYVPHVLSGALVLVIGMLLAKVIASIVYITAKNTDMPIPDVLARLTRWTIVAYVAVIYLHEIGFTALFVGAHHTIFITGVVFALALSFGLAGKDIASKYLSVFDKK